MCLCQQHNLPQDKFLSPCDRILKLLRLKLNYFVRQYSKEAMSRNDNSNMAGGVATGIALLGAAVGGLYALYKFYSSEAPPAPPHDPPPRRRPVSRKCPICNVDLSSDACFTLECDHKFHKLCIKANYILKQVEKKDFSCPICHIPVSPEKIAEMLR